MSEPKTKRQWIRDTWCEEVRWFCDGSSVVLFRSISHESYIC